MNENTDLLPDLLHEEFEVQMRGYSRRQVDEFVARRNSDIRDLEQRLSRSLDEAEHLRRELSAMRQQALSGRPAHEEVSERIAQILKLADDEAQAQKHKADDDITKLRSDAQAESERLRADAREQAERMLTAAQEQAERTIAAARSEADKARAAARTEADRLTSDTQKKSDAALANAKSQAKKVLDEATARATAIHDGADRRLTMLTTRHSETVRRLSDILESVSSLVEAENARPSLEDEVEQNTAKNLGTATDGPARADSPSPLNVPNKPAAEAPNRPEGREKADAPAPKRVAAPLAPPNPSTRVSAAGAPPAAPAAPSASMGPRGGAIPLGSGSAAPQQANDSTEERPIRRGPAPRPSSGSIDSDEATEGIRLLPN